MGAAEEGGKAISGVIESLKSQPLVLSLVIMNLALLAIFYVIAVKSSETRQREFGLIFENQKQMMELIGNRCSSP